MQEAEEVKVVKSMWRSEEIEKPFILNNESKNILSTFKTEFSTFQRDYMMYYL